MTQVKTRGSVSWRTVDAVGSAGETDFGAFSTEVGDNELLLAELKLWDVSLNEHTKLQIASSDDVSVIGSVIEEIVGPQSSANFSISFPAPKRFVTIQARVAEDQQGIAFCNFAVLA